MNESHPENCKKCARNTQSVQFYSIYKSPLGNILLGASLKGLSLLNFQSGSCPTPISKQWTRDDSHFKNITKQLDKYFSGELQVFDFEPDLSHGTDFMASVWRALMDIPYGQTQSYGQLASRIGKPKASRAVGMATGSNPLPIVIPCHRLVGSNGKLVGFHGGLPLKSSLLALEARS